MLDDGLNLVMRFGRECQWRVQKTKQDKKPDHGLKESQIGGKVQIVDGF